MQRKPTAAICALGLSLFLFGQVAVAAPRSETCGLPQDLGEDVPAKYPGARLLSLSDLSQDDRGFFQKDHDDACPGLIKADFFGDGRPTLAFILISGKKQTALVLAHQIAGDWRTTVLDKSEGVPVPVVWSQPPGKYQDVYGNREIRATNPVIVFAGYESWAILFAWTGKSVTKIWIMD